MAGELIPPRSVALTRRQLAQFLPNSELIRAFEALAMDVARATPANELESLSVARLALALAGQAMMHADAEPESPIAWPGARGADGADGRMVVFFEDGEPGEQGPPGPRGEAGSGGGGGSAAVAGEVTITVPFPARIEHEEVVAAAPILAGMRVVLCIAPHTDADENGPEGLSISALSGEAAAGTIVVRAAFGEPTQGPVKLTYLAST